MRSFTPTPAGALIFICLIAVNTLAGQEDLVPQMKTGGHALMLRHALAPGTGDPPGFQVDDCRTQRNLDTRGREQARRIGEWLRARGINQARVFSSQWCRCLETAELLGLGPVTPLPALNSFFERPEEREAHIAALRRYLARLPLEDELVIMVTHFVTIAGLAGEGVSPGEGVVLALNGSRNPQVVGRLGFGMP